MEKSHKDKFRELTKLFALDIDAERVSILANLNRNTLNRYYMKFRERIAQICDRELPFPKGEFEIDESYFGPRRVKREAWQRSRKENTGVWHTQAWW